MSRAVHARWRHATCCLYTKTFAPRFDTWSHSVPPSTELPLNAPTILKWPWGAKVFIKILNELNYIIWSYTTLGSDHTYRTSLISLCAWRMGQKSKIRHCFDESFYRESRKIYLCVTVSMESHLWQLKTIVIVYRRVQNGCKNNSDIQLWNYVQKRSWNFNKRIFSVAKTRLKYKR